MMLEEEPKRGRRVCLVVKYNNGVDGNNICYGTSSNKVVSPELTTVIMLAI